MPAWVGMPCKGHPIPTSRAYNELQEVVMKSVVELSNIPALPIQADPEAERLRARRAIVLILVNSYYALKIPGDDTRLGDAGTLSSDELYTMADALIDMLPDRGLCIASIAEVGFNNYQVRPIGL
jgi:hypothetical protein